MTTDDKLLTALCCGKECKSDTGHCHRFDHITEATRIREFIEDAVKECMELNDAERDRTERETTARDARATLFEIAGTNREDKITGPPEA